MQRQRGSRDVHSEIHKLLAVSQTRFSFRYAKCPLHSTSLLTGVEQPYRKQMLASCCR